MLTDISNLTLLLFAFIFISTPVRPNKDETAIEDSNTSLEQEMTEEEEEKELKVEEGNREMIQENGKEGQEVEEDDSLEWELRNTDSVFSELSELSRDYVESVDRGASVRGTFIKRPVFANGWCTFHFNLWFDKRLQIPLKY